MSNPFSSTSLIFLAILFPSYSFLLPIKSYFTLLSLVLAFLGNGAGPTQQNQFASRKAISTVISLPDYYYNSTLGDVRV